MRTNSIILAGEQLRTLKFPALYSVFRSEQSCSSAAPCICLLATLPNMSMFSHLPSTKPKLTQRLGHSDMTGPQVVLFDRQGLTEPSGRLFRPLDLIHIWFSQRRTGGRQV